MRKKRKYYLKAAERKALKKYLIHETGHYVPKKNPQELEELRQENAAPKPKYDLGTDQNTNTSDIYPVSDHS